MTTEKKAKSWSNLIELLFDNIYDEKIKKYRSNFAYRGMTNANYKLENGLMRIGNIIS